MSYIHINQLNFEFEESNVYHDILSNNGLNTPALIEQIVSVAHIYINAINLELPVAEVPTDTLTTVGNNTQTIEEVIIGTPVPEPEPVVGGGAGQRIRVMGGRPWSEEDVYTTARAEQLIGEEIYVSEIAETYAYNNPTAEARIRKPIYAKPRAIEILSFSPASERTIKIPVEEPISNRRQKEEEELLLLGII